MPTIKLNQKTVDKLRAPDPSGKPVIYWDDTVKGFGVIVSGKKNTKTFCAQRIMSGGICRRVTVGSASRDQSRRCSGTGAGRPRTADAAGDRPQAESDSPTVMETLEDYLNARKSLAKSTAAAVPLPRRAPPQALARHSDQGNHAADGPTAAPSYRRRGREREIRPEGWPQREHGLDRVQHPAQPRQG